MRLRSARQEDAPAIARIWRDAIRTTCAPAYGFREDLLSEWADNKTPERVAQLIVCEEFFIVAEDELPGGIAGFFSASFSLGTFALYVAPARQHGGVGARLFRCYENLASANGEKCLSFHSSLNAVPFYEKMGAQVCGKTIPEPRPCVPMRKDLKA